MSLKGTKHVLTTTSQMDIRVVSTILSLCIILQEFIRFPQMLILEVGHLEINEPTSPDQANDLLYLRQKLRLRIQL